MALTPAQGLLLEACRGGPQQEQEPTTAYRLGLDKGGGWRSPRKVTGWENPHRPSDPSERMVYK
jgi:hypothetical protein